MMPNVGRQTVPLTFQQEFGLRHCMHPDIPWMVYNTKRLRGPLNTDLLRRSLSAVVERHESLRTRIVTVNGSPGQQVDEPGELQLDIVSFPGVCGAAAEAEATAFLQKFFWKQVDLESGPLFDVRLLRLGDRDHVLAMVLHHLITDAVSFNLLLREIWCFYQAFSRGEEADLPAVPMQYTDYARWQRDRHPRWLEQHHEYWSSRLDRVAGVQLPKDGGLDAVSPDQLSVTNIVFEPRLSSSLQQLAQRLRSSTANILLTLHAMLLSRWSGQEDFVLPYVVSGRLGSMDLNVMGYLGQYLPLRLQLRSDEAFVEVNKQVARECFLAYRHLDFGTILNDRPDLMSGASLNGLIGPLDALELTELECGGDALAIEPFPVQCVFPDGYRLLSDAYWLLSNSPAGIHTQCMYRANAFKPQTMQCFLEDLRGLAHQVTRDPTARVSSLTSGSRRL